MGAKSVWLDIMTPEQLADMAQEYMQLKSDLTRLVDDMIHDEEVYRMTDEKEFLHFYLCTRAWRLKIEKLIAEMNKKGADEKS